MRLDMLSHELISELIQEKEGPFVSIYIPLAAEGNANGNKKQLELALTQAEKSLSEMGLSPKGCAQFLASAREYAEAEWSIPHGGKTLALLLSPSNFYQYMVPEDVSQMIVQVGHHYCLAPLLPFLHKQGECYVLTLSKKHARLLHISADGMQEVQVDGMPSSFAEAFAGAEHVDKEVQFHSASGAGGAGPASFHGQGAAKDAQKQQLEEYVQKVAKGVDGVLHGQHAPLFAFCVNEEFGMLRKHLKYAHLQEEILHGKPDVMDGEALYDQVIEHMQPLWEKERGVALEVYGPLAGTGRTSTDLQAVLDHSYHGKVDGLLVAQGAQAWGRINPESGIAEWHEQKEALDSELISLAAIHTLQHRGWVKVIPAEKMPEGAKVAAILRF